MAAPAAFSPDGHRLAIGASDGTVEIWDATPLPEKEQKEKKPLQRAVSQQVAEGWSTAGNAMDNYEMGLDTTIHHGGRASAFIKSKVPAPSGFATISQGFQADEYRGKRLRLSGYVKTKDAEPRGVVVDAPRLRDRVCPRQHARPAHPGHQGLEDLRHRVGCAKGRYQNLFWGRAQRRGSGLV